MLLVLLAASYTDIKKQEIPIWLFPVFFIFYNVINYSHINYIESIVSLCIAVVSYTLLAFFFNGGGGDIIMMSVIAFTLNIKPFACLVLTSSLICLIYYIIRKKKTAPYAPFVCGGYIIILGGIIYASNDYWNVVWNYILL